MPVASRGSASIVRLAPVVASCWVFPNLRGPLLKREPLGRPDDMSDRDEHIRYAAVYIDRQGKTAIMVTLHRNGRGGCLVEDEQPRVVAVTEYLEDFGKALLEVFLKSEVRAERNLQQAQSTNWPAFRASGLRTVRKFESEFIRLEVSGANPANMTCVIEGGPETNSELKVVTSVNPRLLAVFAEKCLLVWRACRDREF